MSKGVLLYCFDTPEVAYHKMAERCVEQIKEHLGLEITIVTNSETYNKFKPLGFINYKIIENSTGNRRAYRGKNIAWNNLERTNAYDDSPYDTTILMDCDYFVFTDNLLTYLDTDYELLMHDKVHDLTGKDLILQKNEATLPIVWATVTIFKKTKYTKTFFDLVSHIKQHWLHYKNLYRIIFSNYRNDYAFAIALHQLNGFKANKNFIPSSMSMLAHEVDVLDMPKDGCVYKHKGTVGYVKKQDIHVMDKEFLNV